MDGSRSDPEGCGAVHGGAAFTVAARGNCSFLQEYEPPALAKALRNTPPVCALARAQPPPGRHPSSGENIFWEVQCHGAGLKLLGITPSACRAASCPWDSPGAAAVPAWARGEAALPQLPASALLSNTTLTIISANNAANRRGRVGRC